jgi:hypothetical protein
MTKQAPAEIPGIKQMSSSLIKSARVKQLLVFALLFGCILRSESNAQSISQKQQPSDKPWQELVSTEGRFSVLMPDTPEEQFVPVPGQIVSTEMHAYLLRSDVATYAVLYTDYPDASKDPDLLKTAFDSGRDRALASGAVRLVSEKDISTANIPGRELVVADGANVMKNRVFFRNGRLYEVIFVAPQVNGMSAELVKFYDGLASKFFGSFKIRT